jgi:hypothetical protein
MEWISVQPATGAAEGLRQADTTELAATAGKHPSLVPGGRIGAAAAILHEPARCTSGSHHGHPLVRGRTIRWGSGS